MKLLSLAVLLLSSAAAAGRKPFWSFQPVRKVDPPAVRDQAWPREAIDQFILSKLEQRGLS